MEKRFKVLRFVGTLYKIFGVVVGVAMLILALGICAVSVMGGASMADYARDTACAAWKCSARWAG